MMNPSDRDIRFCQRITNAEYGKKDGSVIENIFSRIGFLFATRLSSCVGWGQNAGREGSSVPRDLLHKEDVLISHYV